MAETKKYYSTVMSSEVSLKLKDGTRRHIDDVVYLEGRVTSKGMTVGENYARCQVSVQNRTKTLDRLVKRKNEKAELYHTTRDNGDEYDVVSVVMFDQYRRESFSKVPAGAVVGLIGRFDVNEKDGQTYVSLVANDYKIVRYPATNNGTTTAAPATQPTEHAASSNDLDELGGEDDYDALLDE